MSRELRGRRIAVLATDGFEQVELTVPVGALRAAGAEVEIVSLRRGRLRGMNLHEPAGRVRVSRTLEEASPDNYDGLLIPGGFINPDLLRQSAAAREFTRAFDASGKPVATLRHGPWLLASAGRVGGRTLTSWPGIRDDLVHAGATWLDQEVVRDGNWVSSRGLQDLAPFVRAMRDLFAGNEAGDESLPMQTQPTDSSPQRDTLPALAVGALKWLPRPSLRGAAELAALGALAWVLARRCVPPAAGAAGKDADRDGEAGSPAPGGHSAADHQGRHRYGALHQTGRRCGGVLGRLLWSGPLRALSRSKVGKTTLLCRALRVRVRPVVQEHGQLTRSAIQETLCPTASPHSPARRWRVSASSSRAARPASASP